MPRPKAKVYTEAEAKKMVKDLLLRWKEADNNSTYKKWRKARWDISNELERLLDVENVRFPLKMGTVYRVDKDNAYYIYPDEMGFMMIDSVDIVNLK